MKTNSIFAITMVLCSCTISVSSEAKEGITPSKNYITQKVKVDHFEGISTSTSIDVVYTQTTDDTSVEIYAPDNLMEYVKVETEGGMLKIGIQSKEKGKGLNIRGSHETKVYVSAPAHRGHRPEAQPGSRRPRPQACLPPSLPLRWKSMPIR